MQTNKEKTSVALTLKTEHQLKHLLPALNLARSVFYYHCNSERDDKHAHAKSLIQHIFHLHKGLYGYRRIHLALRRFGVMLNSKTVQRLMQQMGLKSLVRPKKYKSYKASTGQPVDNILQRDFTTTHPDEKWVTDVTEFNVNGQKIFLSPIIDLHTKEVIAYQIGRHPSLDLVLNMMKSAIEKRRPGTKPILHSDQGSLYCSVEYKQLLSDFDFEQSMSRKGNCYDNAVAENFFAVLKTEMYHRKRFRNAADLIEKIKLYIEYYNTQRIKAKLKGLTPLEYRNQALLKI